MSLGYLAFVDEVTIRQLRNQGGEVVDGVQAGERLTDTGDGHPVTELRPLSRRALEASKLLQRWRRLPSIDPVRLRCDIDDVIDPSL